MRSASTRQSALRAKPPGAFAPKHAAIGQVRDPGLPLGGASRAPRFEAGFAHGDRHFAHLLAAAAPCSMTRWKKYAPCFSQSMPGKVSFSDASTASSTP